MTEPKEHRDPDPAPATDDLTPRQHIAAEQEKPDFAESKLEERQRPDFIERSKPEDPSDRPGQLTRDNVNPDIPSAPGIVDPNTLGMDQSQRGVAPPPPAVDPAAERKKDPETPPEPPPSAVSINEPPGSDVLAQPPGTEPPTEAPAATPVEAQHEEHATGEADPDDLEDEIEDAEDNGDVTTRHRGKPTTKRKK
jgi:hypothetical protein